MLQMVSEQTSPSTL